MILPPSKQKPHRWALHRGLTPRDAEYWWQDCTLAMPFWEGRGIKQCEDVGPQRFQGAWNTGLDPATDWVETADYGWALNLDGGSGDDLSVADPSFDAFDGLSRFSVEIIFRTTSVTGIHGLVGKYTASGTLRAWRLYLDANEVALQVSNDGVANEIQKTTGGQIAVDTWYHLLVTYDVGIFRVYLNGAAAPVDADFQTHLSVFSTTASLLIAARSDLNRLTGDIAGVRFWNGRVLTSSDAQALWRDPWRMYHHGVMRFFPGLSKLHVEAPPSVDVNRVKPRRWNVNRTLVDPRASHWWRDCVLAMPFWEGTGIKQAEDVGPQRFLASFQAGVVAASDWVSTGYGWALNFDAALSDWITIAHPGSPILDGFSRFSVECIFRPGSVSGTQGLVGKYVSSTGERSWRLYLEADELELQISNDGAGNEIQVTTNANLMPGTWYHLVVTFQAGVWAAYLNGAALTTDANFSTHTTVFAGSGEFLVGARSDAQKFLGDIASVRLWGGRVLSQGEVLELYARPWGMYELTLGLRFPPRLGKEHTGGAAAGPWVSAGVVPKAVQAKLITGLQNGVSYDVQVKTMDLVGNVSSGSTIVAGTPVAGTVAWLRARETVVEHGGARARSRRAVRRGAARGRRGR